MRCYVHDRSTVSPLRSLTTHGVDPTIVRRVALRSDTVCGVTDKCASLVDRHILWPHQSLSNSCIYQLTNLRIFEGPSSPLDFLNYFAILSKPKSGCQS